MIFKLGLKEFRRNIAMNILIIIQLIIIFVVTVSMVSTIVSRFDYYRPFEKELNSKGSFYFMINGINYNSHMAITANDINGMLEGEKEVIASYIVWASYHGEDMEHIISYDDKFIKAFAPKLQDGKWISLADNSDGLVEAVISKNELGLKVGDIIDLQNVEGENAIKCKIVGVLKDGTKILGFSSSKNGYSCINFYQNYNYEIEGRPVLILPQSKLKNLKVVSQLNGPLLVTFNDNITKEQIEKNRSVMSTSGAPVIVPTDDLKENSYKYIFSQIYTLFPIVLGVFILVIISAISVNAISAKKQLKNFAIYYICGLKWNQCFLINLASSIITVLISLIVSFFAIFIALQFNLMGNTVIKFGLIQIIACLVIVILYSLLSIILPSRIIKNTSPNEVLKEN